MFSVCLVLIINDLNKHAMYVTLGREPLEHLVL